MNSAQQQFVEAVCEGNRCLWSMDSVPTFAQLIDAAKESFGLQDPVKIFFLRSGKQFNIRSDKEWTTARSLLQAGAGTLELFVVDGVEYNVECSACEDCPIRGNVQTRVTVIVETFCGECGVDMPTDVEGRCVLQTVLPGVLANMNPHDLLKTAFGVGTASVLASAPVPAPVPAPAPAPRMVDASQVNFDTSIVSDTVINGLPNAAVFASMYATLPKPVPAPAPKMTLKSVRKTQPVLCGAHTTVGWTVTNSGDAAWPEGCKFVNVGGNLSGLTMEVPCVEAGEDYELALLLAAPCRPGVYTSYWQLQTAEGVLCGSPLWFTMTVQTKPVAAPSGDAASVKTTTSVPLASAFVGSSKAMPPKATEEDVKTMVRSMSASSTGSDESSSACSVTASSSSSSVSAGCTVSGESVLDAETSTNLGIVKSILPDMDDSVIIAALAQHKNNLQDVIAALLY